MVTSITTTITSSLAMEDYRLSLVRRLCAQIAKLEHHDVTLALGHEYHAP